MEFYEGINIDVHTGRIIDLDELVTLDDNLVEQIKSGEVRYICPREFDEETILSDMESYLEKRKENTTGLYNNYYLEEDKVCVIVRIMGGGGAYFIVELPLE